MKRILGGVLLAATLVSTSVATANVTVNLLAVADTSLYEPQTPFAPSDPEANQSNAVGDYLFAGRSAPNNNSLSRRALLRFDLSVLPDGAIITDANLRLYLSQTRTDPMFTVHDVALHRALAAWMEGTSDASGQEGSGANATTGDATWLHTAFPDALWTTVGGDFASVASATTAVGDRFQFYTWSGAGVVDDLNAWLNDPASNHGWFLIGDESQPTTAKRFDSRERFDFDPITSQPTRPLLTVTYTLIPEPGTWLLGATGLALVMVWVRRRR